MEFVLELLFQAVIEIVGEIAWEGGADILRTRIGRLVFSGIAGAVGGFFWGLHLSGQPTVPRTVGVSAVLALAGAAAAVVTLPEKKAGFLPWHWSQHQWEGFALLNAFVAGGVYVGWSL